MSFVLEFLADPRNIGAVAPSSRQLARRMVAAADLRPGHVVVELGAGTGPVTRELITSVEPARFVALEPNAKLADKLERRCPGAMVDRRVAQHLPAIVAEHRWSQVDRVVSSLPFAIWPDGLQREVLGAIVDVLAPEGRFVTFSYLQSQLLPAAQRFRRRLAETFDEVTITAWWNLPPALVWCCRNARSRVSRG